MTDRSRVRTNSIALAWRRLSAEGRRTRNLSAAIGAAFFCTGLVLLPGLAALDLAVGVACKGLDRAACIALFQPSPE
jgi:orotate phosphoribosyltransferase-like protein